MSVRLLTRQGIVREVDGGCATIEVGVPCGGCSQAGCGSRRTAPKIRLAARGLHPGEQVRLSLPVKSLTRASLAAFAPPLIWFALTGLALAIYPESWLTEHSLGPALFGCGMVSALALGSWLGRSAGGLLEVSQERIGVEH